MQQRGLFTGHALNAIDAKGRVAIPAGLRQIIEQNGEGRFLFIGKHDCDPCLTGYDRGWSQHLREELRRDEAIKAATANADDRHNLKRRAFGLVEEVPYDSSGRFILPGFFKDKAQLDDLAFFFGTGDTFEIWNPRTLIDAPGLDAEVKEIVVYLMKQRGAG